MFAENMKIEEKILDTMTSRKILGCGGTLMMVEVTFKKGGIGQLHSHDKHEQVSYIAKGSFEVTVGEEKRILNQGDSFYAPLNTVHGVVALEDATIVDVFTPIREDFL